MKSLINKIYIAAFLSMVLIACSKEEVKPFGSNGGGSLTGETKTASNDVVGNSGSADSNNESGSNLSSGDQENNGGTDSGDGSGITDGGTSSDYDSKGTKRKPGKN